MTQLYLVRHEEAEPGAFGPDGHRALTDHGRRRMHKNAQRFLDLGERPDLILTSPLVRAVQTAEILASVLGYDGPLLARNRVAEPASFADLLALLDEHPVKRLVMVGHEPTLSGFVAHLLGNPRMTRGFSPGTMIALEPGKPWTFRWAIWPDEPGVAKIL
jgi:phosphohistidine phosphatase